jgi:hypothetical protein
LEFFVCPETRRIARVSDSECLRILLDAETDVDFRLHTGGQDQAVL